MQGRPLSSNQAFRALADETRRMILRLLRDGPLTSGEIADRFDSSWPTISRHLAVLKESVLVATARSAVLLAVPGRLAGQRWVAELVPLMLGFTMISIGNLLPRTRPNLAIGIRTRLTLSDRALWIRVHRCAGYMVVACGGSSFLSAIAIPRPFGPGMILLVGPAAFVGTCLLVRFSRTHIHA